MAQEQIWVPGAPQPSLADFVKRLHAHIERFARERAGGEAAVEVELRDGSVHRLVAIEEQPGYGFVTFCPHAGDDGPQELIVPLGSIRQLTIGVAEPKHRVGFSVPAEAEQQPVPRLDAAPGGE